AGSRPRLRSTAISGLGGPGGIGSAHQPRAASGPSEGVPMSIEKLPAGSRGAKTPPRLVVKLLMPIMEKIHRRSGDRFGGFDVLYLHTVGAKSGQARTS